MRIAELRVDACQDVKVELLDFGDETETGTRLGVYGGSNVYVKEVLFSGKATTGVHARENSRVYLERC